MCFFLGSAVWFRKLLLMRDGNLGGVGVFKGFRGVDWIKRVRHADASASDKWAWEGISWAYWGGKRAI